MRKMKLPLGAAALAALAASATGAIAAGEGDRRERADRDRDRGRTVLKAKIAEYDTARPGVVTGSGITGRSFIVTRGERSKTLLGARGLEPGKAYQSHVHFGRCEDFQGHFQFERGGAVDSANEVWLTLNANHAGHDGDYARSRAIEADGPLSIVIHATRADGSAGDRVACGDYAERRRGRR